MIETPTAAPAAVDAEAPARPPSRWRHWRPWLSTALFAVVVVCFVMPFASTSCTLPGGYGRGSAGTSTVYRGVDLALDSVPAVTPSDRPANPGSGPNDGRLGVQPLATLALLVALAGAALARTRGAGFTAAHAALGAILLLAAEWVAVNDIASQIGRREQVLPAGRGPIDYVNGGPGFGLALGVLAVLLAVNAGAALWEARRAGAGPAG